MNYREGQSCSRNGGSLALCLLLSLLLHAGLAWALDLLPRPPAPQSRPQSATRHIQVLRTATKTSTPAPQEPEAPFAKTSADEQPRRPEQADFIGKRDSVASGDEDAPQRRDNAPLPTMAGRESEGEIVTFDQERQDGDLAHEGKRSEAPPPPPSAPSEMTPPTQSLADSPAILLPIPQEEAPHSPQAPAATTAARKAEPPVPGAEGLRLDELNSKDALTLSPQPSPPAPLVHPHDARPHQAASPPQRSRAALYDPALAPDAQQPGLRTHERRTRSTGRFIFGRRPSLNVAATARGRYEAEIYRRIARMWYAACDEHRGDIIPGSITVSLRLTKNGRIDSMDLIRRRGASLSQQSFSFGAIRHAALPPMPSDVQQEVIGKLYEMILTFNFD